MVFNIQPQPRACGDCTVEGTFMMLKNRELNEQGASRHRATTVCMLALALILVGQGYRPAVAEDSVGEAPAADEGRGEPAYEQSEDPVAEEQEDEDEDERRITVWVNTAETVPTVSAGGTCTLSIPADRARIRVSTSARHLNPATSLERAKQQAEAIRQAFEVQGLADARIVVERALSTPEVAAYSATADFARNYETSVTITAVTSDVERLGQAIEEVLLTRKARLVEAGPFVSESRLLAAEGDCLAIALGNARARAERMAASLGSALGEPRGITDSRAASDGLASPVWSNSAAAGELLPEQHLEVQLSLSVQFRLQNN